MLKNTKTVAILTIILTIVVIAGFVLIITRKQKLDSTTGLVKSFWKQPKEDTPATT